MKNNYKNDIHLTKKYGTIAGADEVGRGPLAGPVVAVTIIMPISESDYISEVDDSKKLTEKKREELFSKIIDKAIEYKYCFIDNKEIDNINILNSTKKAIRTSMNKIESNVDLFIVDGNVKIDSEKRYKLITKGDARSYSIGCASIVAKVLRDNYMKKISKEYNDYGFESHKGYGTKKHIEAIKKYGPTPIHRKSFITRII